MPVYASVVLAAGWIVWTTPFFLVKRGSSGPAQKLDKRARWGILLQTVGFALIAQGHFWTPPFEVWRFVTGIFPLALSCYFSWTGTRALGKQWRLDAGLNADHQLVRSGPYRFVRHPIYASMICLFLGTGFMVAPFWLFAIALAVFVSGTEIRVHVEEALLGSRFGAEFQTYKKSVPAYAPFLR